MSTSYSEARKVIESVAANASRKSEVIEIEYAVGRICTEDVKCSEATPSFDNSAMDGFALDSRNTTKASEQHPVLFCIKGTVAAGDVPQPLPDLEYDGIRTCVEIMTGAPFPPSTHRHNFDACVPWEDTVQHTNLKGQGRFIELMKPVRYQQNRRFAGSDLRMGDIIVPRMSMISSKHVMAMAALGRGSVSVLKKPTVGVCCTGSELLGHGDVALAAGKVRDVIGPYISAYLRSLGAEVEFFGIVGDDAETFARIIKGKLRDKPCDVLITTGAVSDGKYDIVRKGLELLQAEILFHKVALRPGHPVLLGILPLRLDGLEKSHTDANLLSPTPIFGLPGNPIASAVCFRIFVVQYLRLLNAQPWESGFKATLAKPEVDRIGEEPDTKSSHSMLNVGKHLDHFRHGVWWKDEAIGETKVAICYDQSSSKISPALNANCIVWIMRNHGPLKYGDSYQCFSTELTSAV